MAKQLQTVAIVAGGPETLIPDLTCYSEIDYWIGVDRGAYYIVKQGIKPDAAFGDFDSVNDAERAQIEANVLVFSQFPIEKDKTDMELGLEYAIGLQPTQIILFGATGGRLDHGIVNIQLLSLLLDKGIHGYIVDHANRISMRKPGRYTIERQAPYDQISFLTQTAEVSGLTLSGFYYPLEQATIHWGTSLSVSNKLVENVGAFSHENGILLVIESCTTCNTGFNR